MKTAPNAGAVSACRKSPPAASFSEYLHCFPLGSMSLPGGKQCKETLLRKASESGDMCGGFGLHLEGFGPPNLPDGFFDSLKPHRMLVRFFAMYQAWGCVPSAFSSEVCVVLSSD